MGSNIDAVRRQITLLKNEALSPQAFVKLHAETARAELAKLEVDQGRYPTDVFVDGRRGAAEESVRYGGVIEYHIHVMQDAVDWIYGEWVARSPVGPPEGGHYRDDILLFVDGYRRDAAEAGVVDVADAQEVVLISLRPYARKIARGLSVQAPEGWIEVLAREARRRFSAVAKIDYEYRSYGAPRGRRAAEGMTSRQRAQYRYPAIVVTRGA
ncbi:hypothetical protein [Azospirillum thermophilum]|uniref:Uncharacterized protein n=1 Tax=Azospirillum thermophilum TaxID=2202148 RepID=A0A2S2CKL0_9PROT|nr:hypothetical protein [Azospirillum thermophilum]AWK85031.1 hypothetical protein DEW08_01495 [Azospirillum thermophilum]